MPSDISVIVTTFNQSYETVRHTLRSILLQKDIIFDIIISDDSSDVDLSSKYIDFFKSNGFSRYQIIRNERNLKTVLNIAHALSFAHAPFVKAVDAGDLLYASDTLNKIVTFMRESGAPVGFGLSSIFWIEGNNSWHQSKYAAPRETNLYEHADSQDRAAILKHAMETADWIMAGSQFYKTDYYIRLLYRLSKDFGVRYCQDFTATLALIDGPVYYFDRPVYWYEWGTGISTNGKRSSRRKLYDDHLNFYRRMRKERPLGVSLTKAYLLFRVKRFVALYTPLYHFAVSLLADNEPLSSPIDNQFFLRCVEEKDVVC